MGNINKQKNAARPKIPVDLISGFLGAGKTTFIKNYSKYLSDTGISHAIIENEFGTAGIDAAELSGGTATVVELAGGCICCGLKVNFHDLILDLAKQFDRIIVEPSGIYEPTQFFEIMRSPAVADAARIGGMVAVIDVRQLPEITALESEHMNEYGFMRRQLQMAGGLVLSKQDLCPPGERAAQREKVLEYAAGKCAPIILQKPIDEYTPEDYVKVMAATPKIYSSQTVDTQHAGLFNSVTFYPENLFSRSMAQAAVDEMFSSGGSVLRVKGHLPCSGGLWHINATPDGASIKLTPACSRPMINIIGRGLNRRALRAALGMG